MKRKPYRLILYLLFRVVSLLLYPLPLKIGTKIGSLFGRIAFFIVPKERERALAHLRIAFGKEKTEKAIREIAKTLFSNLGRNAIEWINFPKIDGEWMDAHIKAEGLEHIREARKKGRGTIVLSSHFGNWELMGAYMAHFGCNGLIIARRIYIEQFNRLIVKMRKEKGNDVIYRDEYPKKILRRLNNNGYVGVLADQDVASVEGVFVDFFGKAAYTPIAPVNLAIKTGAALLPVFLIREGDRFKYIAEKEIDLDITGNRDRDIVVNTARWNKVLERYIRKYPDHWVWMHRRWKTRPRSVTSHQMQLIDKISQERFKIPSVRLMESAGNAAAAEAMEMLSATKGNGRKKVAVFCGKGNNGGDGFVVSRILIKNGLDVTTYLLSSEDELKDDPAANFRLLKELDAKIVIIKEGLASLAGLSNYGLIIDAIFGTGFKGSPAGLTSDLIRLVNESGVEVLSVDVPSGLDATTGECKGECIRASQTVTFGLPKSGFFESDGPKSTGIIITKEIGFPKSLLENPPASP